MKRSIFLLALACGLAASAARAYEPRDLPTDMHGALSFQFMDARGRLVNAPPAAGLGTLEAVRFAMSSTQVTKVTKCLHFGTLVHDPCVDIWHR